MTKARCRITVAAEPSTATRGATLTFTATIRRVGANLPAPAHGQVRFRIDGHAVGPVVVADHGVAVLEVTLRAVGGHTVKAIYLGDARFARCVSSPIHATIKT